MAATASKTRAARQHPTDAVPHPSVSERVALGKQARANTPRSTHADFDPPADRPDPVALLRSRRSRASPSWCRSATGACSCRRSPSTAGPRRSWRSDLPATPRSGLRVQCCGDAHLSNFGVFASPERRLVFDINDFDETLPGPWEWDVKRLAASLADRRPRQRLRARRCATGSCSTPSASTARRCASFAAMRTSTSGTPASTSRTSCRVRRRSSRAAAVARAEKTLAKARTRDSMSALAKLTERVNGASRIVDEPPLIVPLASSSRARSPSVRGRAERADAQLPAHAAVRPPVLLEEFELADLARKVVGRRQRRHPRLDRAAVRPRRRATRCSCR